MTYNNLISLNQNSNSITIKQLNECFHFQNGFIKTIDILIDFVKKQFKIFDSLKTFLVREKDLIFDFLGSTIIKKIILKGNINLYGEIE